MKFFILSQDIIILFFDERDGFFSVVDFADFADVAEGDEGWDTSTGDEAENDWEIFEHDEWTGFGYQFIKGKYFRIKISVLAVVPT